MTHAIYVALYVLNYTAVALTNYSVHNMQFIQIPLAQIMNNNDTGSIINS